MKPEYNRDQLCGEDVTPQAQEQLVRLMEEAGEVQQAAAKVLRWGWECWHPDDVSRSTNRLRLVSEVADLNAMAVRLGLEARPATVSAEAVEEPCLIRPVMQTVFGDPQGNCLAACLATVFQCTLADVPDFYAEETAAGLTSDDSNWWEVLCRFAGLRHYAVAWIDATLTAGRCPAGIALAQGISGRGLRHVVVVKDGVLLHDPHPEQTGITEVRGWLIFLLLAEPE